MRPLIAALVAAALLCAAPAASAAPVPDPDHQPCVASSEWALASRGTMHDIEVAWEVQGLGHVVSTHSGGTEVLKQYPYCGRTEDEAFVQVLYDKNLSGQYLAYSFTRWVYSRG